MKIKKILSLFFAVFMICCITNLTVKAENDISVVINGKSYALNVAIKDGTTLMPVRYVTQIMGYNINWNAETKTVNITSSEKAVAMQIDNNTISVYNIYQDENGNNSTEFDKYVNCDISPQIIDAVTYIPLRALAEAFDAEVNWDGATKTITINMKKVSTGNVISYSTVGNEVLRISGNGVVNREDVLKYFTNDIRIISFYNENASYGINDDSIALGSYAFSSWHNIKTVYLSYVNSIGIGAFSYCFNLREVSIMDGLTNIDQSAFKGSGLTEIIIPESVTNIGPEAFCGCSDLTEVTMENCNINEIEYDTFKDCVKLTKVNIPDSVTNIGTCAFSGCKSLKEIIFPDNITNIGAFAFAECSDLTTITLPSSSIKDIGADAFDSCDNLKTVNCVRGSAADNPDLYPAGVEIVYI